MFDIGNNQIIKSHRETMQAKILGSFNSEDPNYTATLVKGMSVEEFDARYPKELYELFSFQAIEKFKDDVKKANADDLVKAETEITDTESRLTPVVVQQGELKKIVFVRKKA